MTPIEGSDYGQDLAVRGSGNGDVVESALRSIDESFKDAVGTSFFHVLTLASIGGSMRFMRRAKRSLGIFIGLWAPTFQALKAAAENYKEPGQR